MFACIHIPDFPVEAMVRAEPWLRERAVAVLEGRPPLTRVIALNEKARLLGMEIGMTKLQAAVFAGTLPPENAKAPVPQSGSKRANTLSHPNLAILRQRSPQQEISAHAALLDVAHAFTPRVEDTAPDTLLLDLEGLDRLYGAPPRMASELAARVMAVGMEGNIAVAANPDAAMHAARGFGGTTVIPSGSEAQRLGVLPLRVLLDAFEISSQKKTAGKAPERGREKLREQMLDTLERWGVRDFRALALLPEHALVSRLGEAGAQLRRLACGEGMRTLVLCEPQSQFEEAMEMESPVEIIASLSFVLNRLLEQLCARLEARALAAHELCLRLQLERRVADEQTTTVQELIFAGSHNVAYRPIAERVLHLPVSMRDPKIFLKLLQLELATHPPGAPVTKIWIIAVPAPPRSAQRGLFLPITPEAEKLEITLARISAVVGERRAGIARVLDSHRQDSFRVDRFAITTDDIKQTVNPTMWDADDRPTLAMRLLRPPCPLQVRLAEERPDRLVADAKQTDREELQGQVVWSAGPWRSSGDWWAENANQDNANTEQAGPWNREEWDIALAHAGNSGANEGGDNIALYRIYRDLTTGRWFADASYD
jgi:protein ImuB